MKKTAYIIYVVAAFAVLLTPLIGMAVQGSDESLAQSEKRDLAPMAKLLNDDGGLNVAYFGDLGAWFEDHFGFRNEMITANSQLRRATTGSTNGDEVLIGRDGWLYYRGTMHDYLGRELMSQRELFDAAHNLRLMQNYVQSRNCTFLFAIVPNKNSIYPEHMPANYKNGSNTNAQMLIPLLERDGIQAICLTDALRAARDTVYFERDTHWNGLGALIGYNEIMDALALEHEDYSDAQWIRREDHAGDLDQMLVPSAWTAETDYYLDTDFTFTYDEKPEYMRDPLIRSHCDTGEGRLYMFRDSFGDAIIPLFSQHFRAATYSMYTPWNLPEAASDPGTDVVIELVERNLTDLLNRPAVLPAPQCTITVSGDKTMSGSCRAVQDGPYVRITGRVDAQTLPENGQIAVRVASGGEMRAYVPFYTSNEERTGNSFCLYLPLEAAEKNLYVEVCQGESLSHMQAVYSGEIQVESGG